MSRRQRLSFDHARNMTTAIADHSVLQLTQSPFWLRRGFFELCTEKDLNGRNLLACALRSSSMAIPLPILYTC